VRELRALGHRVQRRDRGRSAEDGGALAELSSREREIAELATDGMTNREIAASLHLSVKTVETHLRNVFAKLGVSSRLEVARSVERHRGVAAQQPCSS
jgi:DNA-binding NarL/FixJ family response regulator